MKVTIKIPAQHAQFLEKFSDAMDSRPITPTTASYSAMNPPTQPSATHGVTPRTQALWMKHHAFCNEDEATEALCDFRDLGNALETELAAAKAECERLKADVTREVDVCDAACLEATRLSAELVKQADTCARLRAENESLNKRADEKSEIAAECLKSAADITEINARLRAEVERLKALSDNEASAMQWAAEEFAAMKARAERAEAEVLAQAELLGRSAEREADLLGKLSRAEHALAAARKDSERLDWLERNVQEVGFERMNERVLGGCSFDRDAIDAAMTNSNHPTT